MFRQKTFFVGKIVHDFSMLFQCEKFNEYQGSSNSNLWINADLNLAGGNGETKANWNK
jgi:hypothetical protein